MTSSQQRGPRLHPTLQVPPCRRGVRHRSGLARTSTQQRAPRPGQQHWEAGPAWGSPRGKETGPVGAPL